MIIDCSEKKAAQLCHPEWKLKRESLNAFIVILNLFIATRGGKESIKCVWSDYGVFCRILQFLKPQWDAMLSKIYCVSLEQIIMKLVNAELLIN